MLRYRVYFAAKVLLAFAIYLVLWHFAVASLDNQIVGMLVLGVITWLLCGLLYLAVVDQRYRCRVCLRRLRMPVMSGSFAGTLMDSASTEYICPFGHGKLSVPEVELTGSKLAYWTRYRGIWQELFAGKVISDQ